MRAGFEQIGYVVDTIWGKGEQRKRAIDVVKKNIEAGIHYHFAYSESHTTPTFSTVRRYTPAYLFTDYNFFSLCQDAGIPLGLFYRDVYWQFDVYRKVYRQKNSWFKYLVTVLFYHLDLLAYRQWVDVLFLPDMRMLRYVRFWPQFKPAYALPSGCIGDIQDRPDTHTNQLKLLYVGGVSPPLYDIHNLLEGVFHTVQQDIPVHLTICCRREEWTARPSTYDQWNGRWLTIVHTSDEELRKLYQTHDIALIYLKSHPYRAFAMPFKLFEAIGAGLPLLVTGDTAVGDFVKQWDCGWVIEEHPLQLTELLHRLSEHRLEIEEKAKNVRRIQQQHTWASRARQVADVLTHVH
jgi:glycosyltransferase involved in cell wall biosynthesis